METPSTITCNRQQLTIIRDALDLYARTFLGQLPLHHLGLSYNEASAVEHVFKIVYLPRDFQMHASWGAMSPEVSDVARQAFDIHDVIRYELGTKYNQECEEDPTLPKHHVRTVYKHSNLEELPKVVVGSVQ